MARRLLNYVKSSLYNARHDTQIANNSEISVDERLYSLFMLSAMYVGQFAETLTMLSANWISISSYPVHITSPQTKPCRSHPTLQYNVEGPSSDKPGCLQIQSNEFPVDFQDTFYQSSSRFLCWLSLHIQGQIQGLHWVWMNPLRDKEIFLKQFL